MDSVTQILLGATVAGVCAPAGHRRKALLLGAALGTLPDLDVMIDFGGAVENYTYHRGFSHSIFVLAPLATLLWLVLKRWWTPVREAPLPWLMAIMLALLTHPLLDAHTAYGTQLWWPLTPGPASWSTLFIIDPLYTLPLLAGALFAALKPVARRATAVLALGLFLSCGYIGWSWLAKHQVEQTAHASLQALGLESAPVFSVPTPFNSLLWRVVVLTGDGHLEGLYSLVADQGHMRFDAHRSDNAALADASGIWAVDRLKWFTGGFLKASVEDNVLVLADLRMGQAPDYVFTHEVARLGNPGWHPMETRLQEVELDYSLLRTVWRRIWNPAE